MPKNKKESGITQLRPVTIQMIGPLYRAIHLSAMGRDQKVYQFYNLLIMLGLKEWSKTQPPEEKININSPELAQARKLSAMVK